MKLAVFAAVASLVAATSVSAAELGNTGISIGAEVDTFYDFDTEGMNSIVTPTFGYNAYGVDFSLSTDLYVVTDDELTYSTMFDDPTIELGAGYSLNASTRLYGEVNVDKNLDTSGAKAGVSFSF